MFKDFVGNVIKAGDVVCYPVRRGSDMWLARITVTQVSTEGITGYNPEGRRIHVKKLNRAVVVVPPVAPEAAQLKVAA